MFQSSDTEHAALRSQIATSIRGRGGRRYLPYVFTEHGAIMAATILNSPRATEMSVFIVRAFVELCEALSTHEELAKRLDELESRGHPPTHGPARAREEAPHRVCANRLRHG